MSLAAHYRAMARNNAWANHRLLSACAQLDDAAFTAERVSFFPTLAATLNHNLRVDAYYLDELANGGRGANALAEMPYYSSAALLLAAQRAVDLQLIAYCDTLEAATLTQPVALHRRSGVVQAETVGSILPHLFQHQIHHRGQAHAMLAGTAVKPPPLDEYFLLSDATTREAQLADYGLPPGI